MTKTALSFLFLSLFLIISLVSWPLNANERLSFQTPDSFKEKQVLKFIQKAENTPERAYVIAPIDLNGDFIDEYILRPENLNFCEESRLCPHYIVAFQEASPILIGQFDAHKILISHKKAYGIRHIIVYNDLYNDFKTATAIWDPFSFQFKL